MANPVSFAARLSCEENELLRSKAEALDMSKTQFLRLAIQLPIEIYDPRKHSCDSCRVIAIDRLSFLKIAVQLRKWGSNYNQSTRALNTIARRFTSPNVEGDLREEMSELVTIAARNSIAAKNGLEEVENCAKELYECALALLDPYQPERSR